MATTGAALIAEARRRAGITQAELARRSGISRSIINAYERGRREPGLGAVECLLEAAGWRLSIRPTVRRTDQRRAARELEVLLSLADAMPPRPRRPLEFPGFSPAR